MRFARYIAVMSVVLGGWAAQGQEAIRTSPENPTSLGLALQQAVAMGAKKLVITPGVYEIPPAPTEAFRAFSLRVDDAKDLEIDATGVTLVFAARTQQSLLFSNCTNVTFRGATLRRKVSAVSQGVIEAVRDNGFSMDVRIDKGYPADIDNREVFPTFWASIFSQDRTRWLAHYRAATPPVMEKLEKDLYRIRMNDGNPQVGFEIKPGMPIAWRGEVYDDLAVRGCQDMKIIDVTIEGGSGMCLHEQGGGGGNLYRNCKVTYGPKPEGAEHRPMWSSSADTFHSNDARRGPIIENCVFEGSDDDAIAIHGFYSCAVESSGNRLVVWRVGGTVNPRYALPGDTLRFYGADGKSLGEAKVKDSRVLDSYRPAEVYQPDPSYRLFSAAELKKAKFAELILDREVALEANSLVSNVDETSSGYVIRNTVVRGNGARGIAVKADNGLIEGCTIEHCGRAAIEMNPEQLHWPESDYSRNVIIRNNVIRDVSANRQDGTHRHPGALTMYCYRGNDYAAASGHRNILIEGNLFEDNNGVNIFIASAQGVVVKNNRFVRPMKTPADFGRSKGVNPEALIFVTQASDVAVEGNTVTDPGSGMRKLVDVSASASGVNAEGGVKVVPGN